MAHSITRYTWVFNLLVITACALLASKAVGKLAETRLPVVSAELPAAAPVDDQPLQAARDVSAVLRRNVFCSTCPQQQEGAEPDKERTPHGGTALTRTTLQVRLIATLVSEDTTSAPSYAAIRASTDTAFYGVGSKVMGATIVSISERRITVFHKGRLEVLDLLQKIGGATRAAALSSISGFKMPPAGPGLKRISGGIRKVGEGKYEIRKQALRLVLSSPHLLAKGGQVVPVVRAGKPSGIMLRRIRPGSVYSLLGLFSGDTITAVNGRALTSPEVALQLYSKLRTASHLSVAFTRRGTALSHDYTIR